jgi:hypothetical protein
MYKLTIKKFTASVNQLKFLFIIDFNILYYRALLRILEGLLEISEYTNIIDYYNFTFF